MINYLKGKAVEIAKNISNRLILILEVNQIGYEIQIASRFARQLSQQLKAGETETIQVFTHLQIKEDQQLLYGFSLGAERDLFRLLINTSGIGSQLALALLDTLSLEDLVEAIVTSNIRLLTKTPGVGEKTAQKICLELKTKVGQWRKQAGVTISTSAAFPSSQIVEELDLTLRALGYTQEEISQAPFGFKPRSTIAEKSPCRRLD